MFELVKHRRLAFARIFTGATLAVHYAMLLPYAAATYGRGGIVPSYLDNPVPIAASPLAALDAPWMVTAVVFSMLIASVSYAAGLFTRSSGLVLWGGAMVLFHRDQLTLNPSLAYLGLWFLAQAFLPACPSWSLDRALARRRGVTFEDAPDRLPTDVARVVWIVACVGYSFSGLTKLVSPSWFRGEAISLILSSPLGRGGALGHALLALPAPLLAVLTWGVMGLELACAPVALSRRLRPYLWGALLLMHIGLVLVLDIADISVPMIAFHLLTFDPRALSSHRDRSRPVAESWPSGLRGANQSV
jgi:hypothetical protein